MGYRVQIFTPEEESPAGQFADITRIAEFTNETAVRRFAADVDVITFEFENIPIETVQWCEQVRTVRPAGSILRHSPRTACARRIFSLPPVFRLLPSKPFAMRTNWNPRLSTSGGLRS